MSVKITIIGLGKIGLPFAVQAANQGHSVIGCDINPKTVDSVNSAQTPFPGETGLEDRLRRAVSEGKLIASTHTTEAVKQSDAVVILVPVLVDNQGQPDFTFIDSATDAIGDGLKPGTLVCYETTLPVGTTRNRFGKMLEEKSGLTCGQDFYLAFSPERIASGTAFHDFEYYPKIVGGVDSKSEEVATSFYESIFQFSDREDLKRKNGVWPIGSVEAAEFAKLAETTYRDVNIGLSNQFASYAEKVGVDIYRIIEACNSQPYSHLHQPGIAVGGHCIPVYPHFYLQGDPEAEIVRSARLVNKSVPLRMVDVLREHFGDLSGKRVAILGLAYRAGVKEHAFSGAKDLVSELLKRGAKPFIHDPMYSDEELKNLGFDCYYLGDSCDAVILHTNHTNYKDIVSEDFPGAQIFIDGRNSAPSSIRDTMKTFVIGKGF
jgi:nucleotide sugar dehydrogenase